MRNTVAKKLRSIINPMGNSVNKRVYRRAKKRYSKLPAHARKDFIRGLEKFYEQMVTKQFGVSLAQEEGQ
jgi:hypothetical protein